MFLGRGVARSRAHTLRNEAKYDKNGCKKLNVQNKKEKKKENNLKEKMPDAVAAAQDSLARCVLILRPA